MGLTIRVAVIKLAIPKPDGIRSNQKWNDGVCSVQQLARKLATIVLRAEYKVKPYNFPVFRMYLGEDE